MNQLSKSNPRHSERGSAGAKLLFVVLVIALVANAGYNYIPTAYQGEDFKQDMKAAVIQGSTMASTYGTPVKNVKDRLSSAVRSHELPIDTYIDVKEKNNVITARVYYQKKLPIVPFGIYTYTYEFDQSVSPSGFMTE